MAALAAASSQPDAPTFLDEEMPRVPFAEAEFAYEGREDELAPHSNEGHAGVLRALAEQHCLAKVIKVNDWIDFLRLLQGERFRTSLSLLPPQGKGMRLFGKTGSSMTGLLWDRAALDLSDALMWPSGYFARSEHNVTLDGRCLNGREDALVTLERLMHDNEKREYICELTGEKIVGREMPYNEVLGYVHGVKGLVGIFSRTWEVRQLLFALGLRALARQVLPAVGELPLFVIDPVHGARPFGRAAQRKLLLEFLTFVKAPDHRAPLFPPKLPVDACEIGLDAADQLRLHSAYGLTEDSIEETLRNLVDRYSEDLDGCHRAARLVVLLGLSAAVEANNGVSAQALFRHAASLRLFEAEGMPVTNPLPIQGVAPWTPLSLVNRGSVEFGACLRDLARLAKTSAVQVAIGATVALDEYTSGRMSAHINEACQKLETWLADSTSIMFRIKSWHELSAHHPTSEGPSFSSFVTQKAISNRQMFLCELIKLKSCQDILDSMEKLCALVNELHHPCLRLELLQHILGLDSGFDLKRVHDVVALAYEVVSGAKHGVGAVSDLRLPPAATLELARAHMHGDDAVAQWFRSNSPRNGVDAPDRSQAATL